MPTTEPRRRRRRLTVQGCDANLAALMRQLRRTRDLDARDRIRDRMDVWLDRRNKLSPPRPLD